MLDIRHIVFGELQGERTEQRTVCDYCEKVKPCRMFIPVMTSRTLRYLQDMRQEVS